MRQFRTLLFASQGTGDDTQALEQALRLAHATGATLHALIVAPQLPKPLAQYGNAWESSLLDRLKRDIEICSSALGITHPPDVNTALALGKAPAVRIIQQVLRDGCDLVIKQAEPVETRAGFSALDMQLLRQCPCPVWLYRRAGRGDENIRVAVAVDPVNHDAAGHDLAIDLLKTSRALADAYSGELAIISCWHYDFESDLRNNPWIRIPEEEIHQLISDTEREHRTALDSLMAEANPGGRLELQHLRGRPDEAIPRFVADAQIDVLVMGSVARTGMPGFIMGNTAENVLRRLHSSLVVIKPRGFVSSVKAYD